MSETSSPSTIIVVRGKRSHFDKHEQEKLFFRWIVMMQIALVNNAVFGDNLIARIIPSGGVANHWLFLG
jgi:hypothetical protein